MIIDFGDDNFKSFFKTLSNNHVRYMLIGGWAVNYHGYVRATQDMDIWLAPDNENKLKFCQFLIDIGYTTEEIQDIKDQNFETYFVGTVWLSEGLSVDCLTIVHKDISFEEAYLEKETFEISNGNMANIVSYEFLKDMKTRSNRYKDLEDIAKLEEIKSIRNNSKNELS
ncbi:hypothetical protein [Emticicia sp.]|uniref:hypothetical protein n=1 Tax=Emticicia sp. TaxID=1930953 RepID=UPI0037503066